MSTAYAASSRVWFTVSHGTLNEIYYPTIDRPQTRDMELLFSDGETFFHEEKRDLEYDFHYIDAGAPAVRVTASDLQGRYTVTKEFISDPHHPVVLMNVKIDGRRGDPVAAEVLRAAGSAPERRRSGQLGARRSMWRDGAACWRGRATPRWRWAPTAASPARRAAMWGRATAIQDLCTDMKMTWQFGQALNGNIAVMGEIDVAANREFTIAISFGDGHHAAIAQMMQTLATPYEDHQKRFLLQWTRSISPPRLAPASTDGGRLMRISHNVLLTHEDKTYSGAFIASASIPWGASKGDTTSAATIWSGRATWCRRPRLCWPADERILRCARWCISPVRSGPTAASRRTSGSMERPTGRAFSWMRLRFPSCWRGGCGRSDGLGDFDIFPFVERAAAFLVRVRPGDAAGAMGGDCGIFSLDAGRGDLRRWSARRILRVRISRRSWPVIWRAYADWIEAHLDEWTTTNDGVLHPDVKYHYMRIRPPAEGEPFYNPQLPAGIDPHRQSRAGRDVRLRSARGH